ncbi:methyltransferase domain-containing protein [Aliikangiella sp. G2MR2-5]|uniref:methyltransferase domain-containing protein n=1 Tax=Aliikangiella sp. G2MR2-5 TaxID=2788943 RepID=UPI0018AC052B|nr:methyltransferase domain-containing protein [Aliikangiella sp. G2MR2-5]
MSPKNFEYWNHISSHYRRIIQDQLREHLAQIFGYHALLYSNLAHEICRDNLAIQHQILIGYDESGLDLVASFEELPIASDSIDLVVLPNILQNSENPHQILREVERVLIPEGTAIIVGRNPFSWKGLRKRYWQWRNEPNAIERDISRRRIDDWFNLLGFESERLINVSATNDRLQKGIFYNWLKKIGQSFCNLFCSYYIIIAKKKVSTLTPIRPSWRRNKQLVPSRLAEPSVRSQVEHWFKRLGGS